MSATRSGLVLLALTTGCATAGTETPADGDTAAADLAVEVRDLADRPVSDLTAVDLVLPPDLPGGDMAPACEARCQNGCCRGGACFAPDPSVGCAGGGGACMPCPKATADRCLNGQCSCFNLGRPCDPGTECVAGRCTCTPTSCPNGCCDGDACVTLPSLQKCGAGGAACVDCSLAGNACTSGRCACNGNPPCLDHEVCDPQKGCTCDATSCRANGICQPIGLARCGVPDGACAPCDPRKANACDPQSGTCRCGAGPACAAGLYCDTTNVPTCRCDPSPPAAGGCAGCCSSDGLRCETQQSDVACGRGGVACQDCAAAGDRCNLVAGTCEGCISRCQGANTGCCSGLTCIRTSDQNAATGCGAEGAACMVCGIAADRCVDLGRGPECSCGPFAGPCAPGLSCLGGSCVCDAASCPNGCCAAGVCQTIAFPTCGQAGGGCAPCDPKRSDRCVGPPSDMVCSCGPSGSPCPTGTKCDRGSCVCDAQTCPGGCCGAGVCSVPMFPRCGELSGMACMDCDPSLADRCLNDRCSCGPTGPCPPGQRCSGGVCVCDATSCPDGCCLGPTCLPLGLASCGPIGGACMTCDPNAADRCDQDRCSCGTGMACPMGVRCQNGTCVCDGNSCPTGCCSGNVCKELDAMNCALPGGTCMSCDPIKTDTCTNGGCTCGTGPPCGPDLKCFAGFCVCATDPCATCAAAAIGKSYVGCEYWPTPLPNPVWSIFDFTAVVANPQPVAASVTVTGPNNFTTTTTVPPGGLGKIYLPWVPALKGKDMDQCTTVTPIKDSVIAPGGAYRLISSVPVSVYQFNAIEYQGRGGPPGKDWSQCPGTARKCAGVAVGCFSFTNDASLLLPTSALTGNYRITGHHGDSVNNFDYMGAYAGVTATQDNTTVTFRVVSTGRILAGGNIPATAGGGTATVSLARAGDVALFLGDLRADVDLSGSLLTANKPVQVITGVQCIENPLGTAACDHLEESNFPAETLGRDYVVTAPTGPYGAAVGQTVRFIGNFNNTTLTYKPPVPGAPATLNAGQVVELTNLAMDFVVSGSDAFAIVTVQLGSDLVNKMMRGDEGDPSQSLVTSVEQYRRHYIFLAPDDYTDSFADIVIVNGESLTLDGAAVTQAPVPIGTSGYSVVRVRLGAGNAGAHTLTSARAPVGLQVIGYGSYTSYQYPGGLDLNLISRVPTEIQ